MNALQFAHKKIIFSESSPITGRFNIANYRMLEKPLLALSDIRVKRMVWYKASSALGTVALQIALAYWLDQTPHSIQVSMQSDDDADEWSKTRGKRFILGIPSISETLASDKYAVTNALWQWPHRFLKITGPGENAQQAKQVTYLATDESHVDAFKEGALASFEERMSKRWNRMGLHVTTAADEGKEVDRFYYLGGQNEFHLRCPSCNELVWPLWEEDARNQYNGERVFHFGEGYETVAFVCPHCEHGVYNDTSRERYALHEHADYVCKNPDHLPENESYRWNCFAAHWIPWSEQLNKYREALEAAKMGNLQPHENFVKKRLCQSYRPEIPDLGDGCGSSDYVVGSVWITEHEKLRVCSFDVQASEGRHYWGQVDEYLRNGASRRVDYARISSWESCRAFQQQHSVRDEDTYCDAGHEMREVFGRCAQWHWYALLSTDDNEFLHYITDPRTKEKTPVRLPYSMTQLEDSMSGKKVEKVTFTRGIPPGYCISRRWSKPVIGGYLMALKAGNSRYYGIAKDINPDYTAQLNSYTFASERNKKTGALNVFLKQVKAQDHSFATSSQCLLGAVIKGYFPLSQSTQTEEKAA